MESFGKSFCKFFQTLFSPVVDENKMINLFWSKAKRNSDSKQEKEKKATLQHRIWLRIPRKKKNIIPRTGRVRTRLRHSVSIVPFGCLTTAAPLPTACNTLKLLETIRRAMPTSNPAPSHMGALGPSKRSISQQRENITSVATPWLAVGTVVWRLSWLCITEKPALRHKVRAGTLTIGSSVARSSPSAYQQRCGQTCKQWASDAANAKAHGAVRAPARKAHRGWWHVYVAWAEWMRRCRRTGHAGDGWRSDESRCLFDC